MTDGNSQLASRYADRVLALVRHCPAGKSLNVRDKDRFVQCVRRGDRAELDLKMGLRSDVSGAALLHARFRLHIPPDGEPSLSLHHLEGRRETAHLTGRQEKYLSALMAWAGQVLPGASPVAQSRRVPLWQRQFADLYHLLSDVPVALARRRLREAFFVDQQDAMESTRMEAFLDMMRDEGWIALVDGKEETVDDIILQLVEQRLPGSTDACDSTALAESGHDLVLLDDGSDQSAIAVLARGSVTTVGQLLADLAPQMTVRRFGVPA